MVAAAVLVAGSRFMISSMWKGGEVRSSMWREVVRTVMWRWERRASWSAMRPTVPVGAVMRRRVLASGEAGVTDEAGGGGGKGRRLYRAW